MSNQRLVNMVLRMATRFGMRWLNKRSANDGSEEINGKDRRAYRGKQPTGDAAKRMRALRRMTRF